MARWFLYPAKTEAPRQPQVEVVPDFWFQPFSNPTPPKIARRLAIALAASGLFYAPYEEIAPPTETEIKWYAPLSDPVRVRSGLQVSLHQSYTESLFPTEIVTEDKWHQPWSYPLQQRRTVAVSQTVNPPHELAYGWYSPLSDPKRSKRSTSRTQISEVVPPHLESYGGVYRWPDLIGSRASFAARQQSLSFYPTPIPAAEIVTLDKWLYQFSDPVRHKKGLKPHLQQFTQYDPSEYVTPVVEVGAVASATSTTVTFPRQFQYQGQTYPIDYGVIPETQIKWFACLSEPVRRKRGHPWNQPYLVSDTNPTISFGWNEPLSDPVWQKRGQPWNQQYLVSDTKPSVSFGWNEALSEPVRRKPGLRAGTESAVISGAKPEVSFGWNEPLSEPVRHKPGLRSGTEESDIPGFNPEVPYGWRATFSEPVRVKSGLRASQQQSTAFAPYPIPPDEIITVDKWLYQLSEPVRLKLGLLACLQQFYQYDPSQYTPPVEGAQWYARLSEPVRLKRGLGAYLQQFSQYDPYPTPVVGNQWYAQLSEPVRKKRGLGAHLQQFYQYDPSQYVVSAHWYASFSDPVRKKPGLGSHLQQSSQYNPFPPVVVGNQWYAQLSEPVRRKRGLSVTQQPFCWIVQAAPFGEVIYEDRWHQAWTQPLFSRKGGLPARYQDAGGYTLMAIVGDGTTYNWFASWSIPVKLSADGLDVSLQPGGITPQPIFPPFVPPPPSGDEFRVSGRSVEDLFITTGVSYTYAAITKKTN